MKKKILKALAVVACAILLVVGSVAGTLAYLTAETGPVTNTFTVGKVTIKLDEAKVNEYGVPDDDADRVTTNEYKLVPARTYVKDPKITVGADSEDCWLFVKVVNGLAAIEDVDDDDDTYTIEEQLEANGWTPVSGETNVYYYTTIATAGIGVPVFNSFTLADDADVAAYKDADPKIIVTAYAIQSAGLADANTAWSEYDFGN